jgi:hypothetical protein
MAIPLLPGSSPIFTDSRTELNLVAPIVFLGTDRVENPYSYSTSIVARLFVATGKCLTSRCLETSRYILPRGHRIVTALHATI